MVREEIKGEGRRISCLALLFVDRFVLFSSGKHMEKIDSFVSQSMLKRVHGPLFGTPVKWSLDSLRTCLNF
jgi:hypothetical protein